MSEEYKIIGYKAKLQKEFPDLAIRKLKIIGSGWHHDAIEVNGGVVFRIPKGIHETDSSTENEISILRLMKDKLPVQIPDPLFISPKHEYFGYPKVQGTLLDELVNEFSEVEWECLKSDWVNIASLIHSSVSLELAHKLKIPNFLQPGPNTAEKIFDIADVDKDILEFANKTINQYKQLSLNNFDNVLIHNDLQFHNILANQETKRISGLIDWTDACIGPISREFAISEWWAKPGLLEEVTKLYEIQTGKIVDVDQVKMWRNLEELSDYAENTLLGENDQAQKTLKRIRALLG